MFDPKFRPEYRSKSQLNCQSCHLYLKIGRAIRTPDVTVQGINIRKEILQFTDMPVKNSNDPDHYFSPLECRKYMKK
eukprot:8036356-Ditylum_brightwellii.AAC.1